MSNQIELVHLREELELNLAAAESKAQDNASLSATYGDGVRPGWVGEEMAINYHWQCVYQKRADEAQAKIDAIKKEMLKPS